MPMISDVGSDDSALSSTQWVEEEAYPRGDVFEGWGLSWALCPFSFLYDIFLFFFACSLVFVAELRS